MDVFYFEDDSSEGGSNNLDDIDEHFSKFYSPPPIKCNCSQINKERYEIWVNNTTLQERYEAINNPKSIVKQPVKIECKECVNLNIPCLAS